MNLRHFINNTNNNLLILKVVKENLLIKRIQQFLEYAYDLFIWDNAENY